MVDDHERSCEQMAHLFADTQDVIFLGRGINSRSPLRTP
jgi:glucosamine--fructose-6-phosphate aminotransferase (isomerizing)